MAGVDDWARDSGPFFASTSVKVVLPYGKPVPGLVVSAVTDEGPWTERFESKTDGSGVARFDFDFLRRPPTKSPEFVRFVFEATWEDSARGLHWSGRCEGGSSKLSLLRGSNPRTTQMVLERDREESYFVLLQEATIAHILGQDRGDDLLYDFLELSECIHLALPVSGLNMAGRVLDDAFWLRGRQEGWPTASWGKKPSLGVLIDKPEVQADLKRACGEDFPTRLQVVAITLRNLAAHQKQTTVSLDDGRAARSALKQLIETWWPGVPS